jgi:hypothetical protein
MVLGTVDPSGRPRVSPVWFSLVDHRVAYWLSSPDARHSRNIEQRPEVSMVVFDSSADPHTGQAVYLDATAGRVPDDELGDACAEAFRDVDDELSYTSETLRDEPFVLYRARVTAWEIHVRLGVTGLPPPPPVSKTTTSSSGAVRARTACVLSCASYRRLSARSRPPDLPM